jgi:hypothetical protein
MPGRLPIPIQLMLDMHRDPTMHQHQRHGNMADRHQYIMPEDHHIHTMLRDLQVILTIGDRTEMQ